MYVTTRRGEVWDKVWEALADGVWNNIRAGLGNQTWDAIPIHRAAIQASDMIADAVKQRILNATIYQ